LVFLTVMSDSLLK